MLLPIVVVFECGNAEWDAIELHGAALLPTSQEAGGEDSQVQLWECAHKERANTLVLACLLYTSDAADE